MFNGQTVLVCDVGGGHQRFSLIKVIARRRPWVNFTRTAVGRLCLGGGAIISI